jgi:hypothetical protein
MQTMQETFPVSDFATTLAARPFILKTPIGIFKNN